MTNNSTIKGRFAKLDGLRQAHLNRARLCSELTLPFILPKEGKTQNDALPTPYQGVGARCVNNLASKLLLALMPPNSPFFRLKIDPKVIAELKQELGDEKFKTDIEAGLARTETDIAVYIESLTIRVPAFRLFLNLIVTGNCLMVLPDDGGMKVHRLDQYVVRRDPMGNVIETIIKEGISRDLVPEKVLAQLPKAKQNTDKIDESLGLYTRIWRDGKIMNAIQEIEGVEVPETDGSWSIDHCPYKPLTWVRVDGEDYGRGHVEAYLGDFISIEGLAKAIVEGSAAAARILFLVDPNGMTREKDLRKTPNLGFGTGRKDDVTVLQLEKYHDFQIAFNTMQKVEERLEAAFLLTSSVQRAGERVTATEIQFLARELEDALGGIYSVLSQEFQSPLVKRVMHLMQTQMMMPYLPDVKPTITTGLEALGRGHDLAKLDALMQHIAPLGPDVVKLWVKVGNYLTRVCTSLSVNPDGLIATEEEVNAIMAQQKQEQMMMEMGKPAIGPIAGALAQNMTGGKE
jgi:hypothetical protein